MSLEVSKYQADILIETPQKYEQDPSFKTFLFMFIVVPLHVIVMTHQRYTKSGSS